MKYVMEHIRDIVQGTFLQFRRNDPVEHLLLDSRRLIFPDTSLFFSLKGPRREGSSFMEELYRRGVRNFVVQEEGTAGASPVDAAGSADDLAGSHSPVLPISGRPMAALPDANIILVKDSLTALQQLASWHRQQFSLPVIGITGSNGKTIVKEWLNQLLEDEFHIVRSPKSYNSQIGVPLSVWQLNEAHELAIFEAGISRRGEMPRLEKILQPTIGLFTNIGEAHSEGFASRMEKAGEKWQLFDHSELIIYCKDQPETEKALAEWRQRQAESRTGVESGTAGAGSGMVIEVAGATDSGSGAGLRGAANSRARPGLTAVDQPQLFSWGHAEDATLVILSTETRGDIGRGREPTEEAGDPMNDGLSGGTAGSTVISARYKGQTFSFTAPFTDEASLENVLHCVAVLLHFGQPVERIREKIQRLSPIAMRLELKGGINHCSIINDSYSADLSSLSIALDFLSQQQQHIRRTVILSDFLESGLEETFLYMEIARVLRQKQVDRLVGVGNRISAMAELIRREFPGETSFYPSVDHFKKDF
ncbi:MAG: Mur ligase family protein, partial [Bacteroidota bacterium]